MFQNKYLSLVALLFLFCQTSAGLYRSVNTIKSLKPLRPVIQNVGISQLTRMPVVPAMPKFSTTGENPITPLVYPQNLRPGSPDFVYKNQHMNFMPPLSSIDFSKIFLEHKVSGLNQMDFSDLLKTIKSNDEYANLAAQLIRQRIGQRQIIINNYILPFENKDMFISGNKFVIRNTSTALDYLEHFGSDIWSLEIEFLSGDKKDVRKVMKYVDRYCSESLVELKMTVWHGKTPLITRRPFQNVKELVLINRSIDGQTSLPTSLSFPALESLHLEVLKFDVIDPNILFPNLFELSAYVNDKSTEQAINTLIDMNPHIKKLELTRTSSEFLQKVTKKLSKLESLNIAMMDSSEDRIRIENLEEFTTPRHSCNFMNYDFPNLKILNVFHEAMPVNKLTEFLEQHRNLTGFNVIHRTMFDDEFVSITSLLPELIDVSVIDTTRSPMNTNSIVMFIENHPKLMKFYVNECDQNDKPFLRKQLGSDWKIEDYDNGLLFERAQRSMFNKLFSKIGIY